MKPFEIPYNFDTKLIDFLNIYNNIDIHCIYVAPFREHYRSAKFYEWLIPRSSPQNLSDYEYHIHYIKQYYPDKLMLLLQQNDILLDDKLLDYYISLGFTKFCVGSLEQGNRIRQKGNYEIIGSITLKIDNKKLLKDDYSNFDGFILWFPFNRNIYQISQLPKNFKYSLLINCGCNIRCNGTEHWLVKTLEEKQKFKTECPNIKYGMSLETSIIIPKYDLKFFDPYISYYKLQGREFPTCSIIEDIVKYNYDRDNKYGITEYKLKRDYDPYQLYNIKG